MADPKLDPAADIYGYGPPDDSGFNFYPDPSSIYGLLTIGLEIFLLVAVGVTLFTISKQLLAFARWLTTRARPQRSQNNASQS